MSGNRHYILKKVFSHCPFKKMRQFSKHEDNRTAFIRLDYVGAGFCTRGYLISIRVWGIGTFRFATTFLKINEIGSTLEPENILYLSDYQIIHSILIVI